MSFGRRVIVALVSIHASTREATKDRVNLALDAVVSIHASTREATRKPIPTGSNPESFDPRLHAGGDRRQPN